MKHPILLATRSAGKLRELVPMFLEAGFRVIDLAQAGVPETAEEDSLERFDTFEQNAVAKARYFRERTGLPTVADDSGLEVAVLGGAPGVRSKRWSERPDLSGQLLDDENNRKLLRLLRDRAAGERGARYVCVAAFVDGVTELVRRGTVEGEVTLEPRGCSGFGYDPFFYSYELQQTFGEATRAVKEGVSHRGRAFHALLSELRSAVDRASD